MMQRAPLQKGVLISGFQVKPLIRAVCSDNQHLRRTILCVLLLLNLPV